MAAGGPSVDVAVIGAGPAGMAAAIAARGCGASVVLLDEQAAAGGQIYRGIGQTTPERRRILGPDYAAGANLISAFAQSGAQHIAGASVWQVTADHQVDYLQQGSTHSIKAESIIMCSGAMERPFPIPGWTLPGVMTAGAAQIMLKNAGVVPSGPVILAGCGPLLYLLAWQYVRAGVQISAIVDTTNAADYVRALPHIGGALAGWRYLAKGLALMAALKKARVRFYKAATDLRIAGDDRCSGLEFLCAGVRRSIACSLVLLHQGVVPNTQFSWSLRATHEWNPRQLCWTPVTNEWGELDTPGMFVAGDAGGIGGAQAAALKGRIAGLAAAARSGKLARPELNAACAHLHTAARKHMNIRPFLDALYRPKDSNRMPPDAVTVCRCEEVAAGDIRGFVALGCQGPNQAKSFGRCGMGPCQGRLCGLTVTELIAQARAASPDDVGYYRIRPPIKPITLGELARR